MCVVTRIPSLTSQSQSEWDILVRWHAAGALNVSQTKQTSWIHNVVRQMRTWVCTEQRCFIVDCSLKDSMWANGHNTHCFCKKFFPPAAPSLVLWVVWSIPARARLWSQCLSSTKSMLLFLAGPVRRFTLHYYTWDSVYGIDSSIYNS